MSDSKHRPSSSMPPGSASTGKPSSAPKRHSELAAPENQLSSTGKSGRVAFDPRGNPIWEWQTSTGVFDRNVTTQRLKKLEAKDLTLVDTQSLPRHKGLALEEEPTVLPGDGMNPYNSGGLAHKTAYKHLPKLHSHSMSAHKTSVPGKRAPVAAPKPQSAWQRIKSKLTREEDED